MGLKTKMAMAVATSAAGAALVVGGSFALFSGSTTNNGNTFTAGTVVISDHTGGPVAHDILNFNNLAPGDGGMQYLTIKNNGTLDAWVNVDKAKTTTSGYLFSKDGFILLPQYSPVYVASGDTVKIPVYYKLPLSATMQGVTGNANITVDAVQAKNNTSDILSNYGLVTDGPGRIIANFTLSKSINLSNPGANVILSYQTSSDHGKTWTEVYRKDKTWEGYLNSGSGVTATKYSSGIYGLTPDYNSGVSQTLPPSTNISTLVTDGGGRTWVDSASATNLRVVVTVSNGFGANDVQTLTLK